MTNKNDILAMLNEGKSIDAIAEEFTQAMNAAKAEYEQKQADVQKRKEAEDILRAVRAFLKRWYGVEDTTGITVDEAISWVEDGVRLSKELEKLVGNVDKISKVSASTSADTKLADFLNKMGW